MAVVVPFLAPYRFRRTANECGMLPLATCSYLLAASRLPTVLDDTQPTSVLWANSATIPGEHGVCCQYRSRHITANGGRVSGPLANMPFLSYWLRSSIWLIRPRSYTVPLISWFRLQYKSSTAAFSSTRSSSEMTSTTPQKLRIAIV